MQSSVSKLANLVSAARESKAALADNGILLVIPSAELSYLPMLKSCSGAATIHLAVGEISTIAQVRLLCNTKKATRVLSTSVSFLRKLLDWDKRAAPSLDAYAGSYFSLPADSISSALEIVFLPPLKQLATVPYGKFMAKRFISKFTSPDTWFVPTEFTGFTMIEPANAAEVFDELSSCSLIAIDIETVREAAQIKCISYTGAKLVNDHWVSYSYELALDSEFALATMTKFNWELKAPKIFQNGKYDIAYFTRYGAPVYNYLYDTAHLFHCWSSELPKDLGFLNAFFIRKAVYWKDLAQTTDLYEYYRYNCLDTWGTLNCFLAMLSEVPSYAIDNYTLEFPLVFPCHLAEMTGINRDMSTMEAAKKEQQRIVDTKMEELNAILSIPTGQTFNVQSPPQMKALFKLLGCSDLPNTDAKAIAKARFRHPVNSYVLGLVLTVRKARKLVSTYLTEGNEFTRLDGSGSRILYALNPHGTDSGRLASREHHFWKGINIQNVPRGKLVKQTFKADPGFRLAECDLEQAESRDTAYISGEEILIHNVEYSPDFHKMNASMFFGIPFEEVSKDLRSLAKPVNHGANYNMGPRVLIDTMGEENILLARRLLNLPTSWTVLDVAEHLLAQFHRTYPKIAGYYYPAVVRSILNTRRLASLAVHHTNWHGTVEEFNSNEDLKQTLLAQYPTQLTTTPRWTRYCFGSPESNKQHMNSYISHPPQSLNAQTLNKAYLKVFNTICLNPELSPNFKLLAQIHDSILFQYRIGHEYLCDMVKSCMEIPLTIRAYDNKVRSFIVPAGVKRGQHTEAGYATYWSETE